MYINVCVTILWKLSPGLEGIKLLRNRMMHTGLYFENSLASIYFDVVAVCYWRSTTKRSLRLKALIAYSSY